ncbi:unnamed protein product, partial [Ectocarpus sp. 12 AP-2014]
PANSANLQAHGGVVSLSARKTTIIPIKNVAAAIAAVAGVGAEDRPLILPRSARRPEAHSPRRGSRSRSPRAAQEFFFPRPGHRRLRVLPLPLGGGVRLGTRRRQR